MTTTAVHGIPTMASGYRMRSRLEARWAAFFDLVGWQWEYEPMDCPGWIPDFLLIGETKTLVEVKPIIELDEDVARKCLGSLPRGFDFLLVGIGPFQSFVGGAAIGWTTSPEAFEDIEGEVLDLTETMTEAVIQGVDGGYSFDWCSSEHSFRGRQTGRYDGCIGGIPISEAKPIWAKACNQVQWMPR